MITHQFIYKHVHNSILNLYKYNSTLTNLFMKTIIFKHSSFSKKINISKFFSQTVFIIRSFHLQFRVESKAFELTE